MVATPWKTSTSALALATLASLTEFRVVDDPAGTPTSKKTTAGAIKTYINGLANTWSAAGAVSAPAAYWTGAVLTTGDGTTSFPHIFYQPTGATAATDWSTAGTAIGVNMATGFTGSLIHLKTAGTTRLKISGAGAFEYTGTAIFFSGNNDVGINYNASGEVVARVRFGLPAISPDTFLTRSAAASLQLGLADAASPVAQNLLVQSVVAGTSNTAGADWTHKGSRGTGTAAGGKLIFQTAPAGATGTSQNTLVPGLTITAPAQRGGVTQQPSIVLGNAALATADTDGYVYIPTCAGTPTGVPTANTGRVAFVYDTTGKQFWIYDGAWLQPKTPAGAAIVTWQ